MHDLYINYDYLDRFRCEVEVPHDTMAALELLQVITCTSFSCEWVFRGCTDMTEEAQRSLLLQELQHCHWQHFQTHSIQLLSLSAISLASFCCWCQNRILIFYHISLINLYFTFEVCKDFLESGSSSTPVDGLCAVTLTARVARSKHITSGTVHPSGDVLVLHQLQNSDSEL